VIQERRSLAARVRIWELQILRRTTDRPKEGSIDISVDITEWRMGGDRSIPDHLPNIQVNGQRGPYPSSISLSSYYRHPIKVRFFFKSSDQSKVEPKKRSNANCVYTFSVGGGVWWEIGTISAKPGTELGMNQPYNPQRQKHGGENPRDFGLGVGEARSKIAIRDVEEKEFRRGRSQIWDPPKSKRR